MCFGNDSPPRAPVIGAPPPAPEFMDIFDDITGTQSIVVTGPDGKKRRVNSRLPRSPEEEQRFKAAEQLIASSMKNITELYKYNPESMVDFAPLINTYASIDQQRMQELGQIANIGNIEQDIADFKQMQNDLIDREISGQKRAMEETLSHRGRGSGSYAAAARSAMANDEVLTRQKGDINARVFGEDLAAKRLERNKQAFGLNEMGREGQLQSVTGQYALAKEHEADMEQRRQRAIEENQNLMGIGSSIVGADLNKAMANSNTADSLNTFNAQASDSMNRYNADVNRQVANYKMASDEYKNRPPSFAQQAFGAASTLGTAYLSGGRSFGFGGAEKPRAGSDTVGIPYFSKGGRR